MSAIPDEDLEHLDDDTAERVREVVEIDPQGPGIDQELDHVPGAACALDLPLAREEIEDLRGDWP